MAGPSDINGPAVGGPHDGPSRQRALGHWQRQAGIVSQMIGKRHLHRFGGNADVNQFSVIQGTVYRTLCQRAGRTVTAE